MSPVLDAKLQVLTSESGVFTFVYHSTNPEKYHVEQKICIKELHRIFKGMVRQETDILHQVMDLKQLI